MVEEVLGRLYIEAYRQPGAITLGRKTTHYLLYLFWYRPSLPDQVRASCVGFSYVCAERLGGRRGLRVA